MNKKIKLITAIAFIFISKVAFAVQREDVLECGLPNGDKFILISKYDYSLAAKLLKPISRHASVITNRSSYDIQFVSKLSRTQKKAPIGISFTSVDRVCQGLGIIDDMAIANITFFGLDGTWFDPSLRPSKLRISKVNKQQPEDVRQQLETLDASPAIYADFHHAFILPKNGKLFYEVALVTYKDENGIRLPDGKIVAVYQSTSIDEGKTWTDPIITKDAKIYELGKSTYEQSFIARPISINGKKIEAHFPTPPDKTKLTQ